MDLFNGMEAAGVPPNECQDATRARSLLDETRECGLTPDPRSYAAATTACGANHWRLALERLEEMEGSGCAPDAVCYNRAIECLLHTLEEA